ncbi:MAG: PEP-CTERM sorting domain-containing protein [Deltaproteobacteria bacterium]|nr:PEP-CTERM sorting domain-containing protein [Deltaproteobacteria bacterium]
MKTSKIVSFALAFVFAFSSLALAATVTDIKEYNTGFFVENDAHKYDSHTYWRWYNQDWGWQHSAIAGTITTATLNISAFDVDLTSGEIDNIYAYDGSNRVLLGSLDGSDNIWSYTAFTLGANFYDDILAGLKIEVDIDSTHNYESWALTLAKSVLSIDGGVIPDPDPDPVPEPSTMILLGAGLAGLFFARRKFQK